ncbi:hypothetical protein [Salirhabdus sp. Marseille-P4669]|uniref:hypothetical protein n=1 Tax=Salirhabdus sp. Marseille-P4669 TaxID=2042310 RepID=UPI000C7D6326|nr:hypothetical protein [Salirhabdus sp. Marseille-P4669]
MECISILEEVHHFQIKAQHPQAIPSLKRDNNYLFAFILYNRDLEPIYPFRQSHFDKPLPLLELVHFNKVDHFAIFKPFELFMNTKDHDLDSCFTLHLNCVSAYQIFCIESNVKTKLIEKEATFLEAKKRMKEKNEALKAQMKTYLSKTSYDSPYDLMYEEESISSSLTGTIHNSNVVQNQSKEISIKPSQHVVEDVEDVNAFNRSAENNTSITSNPVDFGNNSMLDSDINDSDLLLDCTSKSEIKPSHVVEEESSSIESIEVRSSFEHNPMEESSIRNVSDSIIQSSDMLTDRYVRKNERVQDDDLYESSGSISSVECVESSSLQEKLFESSSQETLEEPSANNVSVPKEQNYYRLIPMEQILSVEWDEEED